MRYQRCACPHITIRGRLTDARRWSADCFEHGVGTEWFRNPELVLARDRARDRARQLRHERRVARWTRPTVDVKPHEAYL